RDWPVDLSKFARLGSVRVAAHFVHGAPCSRGAPPPANSESMVKPNEKKLTYLKGDAVCP
ncbi:hypothetical protein EVAR_42968_1, partial [Eumeta japonica]